MTEHAKKCKIEVKKLWPKAYAFEYGGHDIPHGFFIALPQDRGKPHKQISLKKRTEGAAWQSARMRNWRMFT